MNKKLRLTSLFLALLTLCFVLCACGNNANNNNVNDEIKDEIKEEIKEEIKATSLSYVSIRINPEIELVVDEEEIVVAVNAINEDGEVVLSTLDLIGKTVEDATELIVAKAIELEYIDINSQDTVVYVLTESETEEEEKVLEDKLCDKIDKFFGKHGHFGKGCPEDLEEYKELALEWGVSLKTAKLIERILELYPEKTLEELLELSKKELCELVKDDKKENGLPAHLRDEYKEAVEALKEEYAEYFTLKEELKALKEQLKDETLTEEELLALQTTYEEKLASYNELKEQFKKSLEELKDTHKQNIDKVKDEIKKENDKRHEKCEELKEKAKEWGVSLKKAKLITKILESNPDYTVEELKELSYVELLELLSEDKEEGEFPEIDKPLEEILEITKEEIEAYKALKQQIKELIEQLQNESLTEEELLSLKEQYDELYAQYQALKEKYQMIFGSNKDHHNGNGFGKH